MTFWSLDKTIRFSIFSELSTHCTLVQFNFSISVSLSGLSSSSELPSHIPNLSIEWLLLFWVSNSAYQWDNPSHKTTSSSWLPSFDWGTTILWLPMVKMSVAPLILLPALPPNNNMHSVNCYLIEYSSWVVLNSSQATLEPSLALAISSQLITIFLPLHLHGNCYLNLQPLLDIKFLQFLGLCPPLSDS